MQERASRRRALQTAAATALTLLHAGRAQAQADDIVVGQIGPFTGLPSLDAHEINAGVKAVLARVNARGGVGGRKLTLFELDDGFTADGFARQFAAAMQKKPVALINPIGSAAMQRLVQGKLLDDDPVVVVNAIPGAEAFRKPGHPLLFHVRAGDRQQLERIVANALTMGISRMQVLYQSLPIGAAGMAVVRELAAKPGSTFDAGGSEAKHEPAAIAEAAKAVLGKQPQGVVLIGSPKFMADALDAVRKAGGRQFLFALSYLPPGLAAKVAGAEGARGLGIAQTFPNPGGSNLPLQRGFRAAMTAFDAKITDPTSFHLEGYLTAMVLVEGLQRAGANPTVASLTRGLKQMGELNLGGFRVDFSASNEGSRYIDIAVVSAAGKLIY